MASSSAGQYISPEEGSSSSSSSRRSPPKPTAIEDYESDDDDPVANHSREQALFSQDPFDSDIPEVVSFKRKQKQPAGSRFLSVFSGNTSRQTTPSPRTGTPTLNSSRSHGLNTLSDSRDGSTGNGTKDGPLDWYVEGPGRRVGYQDMTAIDWIFEYTKERQRLRMLYASGAGLLGYIQQFMDASQVWVVLILTGLATGIAAATIDVASDWLGDLKTGYCAAGEDGGHFYLNKYFCCYGFDGFSQCRDWIPWSRALHITSSGGVWFIEYFFFIIFSVRIFSLS
jgi:chloride channel 3/4/5